MARVARKKCPIRLDLPCEYHHTTTPSAAARPPPRIWRKRPIRPSCKSAHPPSEFFKVKKLDISERMFYNMIDLLHLFTHPARIPFNAHPLRDAISPLPYLLQTTPYKLSFTPMKPSLPPRHIKTDHCSLITNDCLKLILIVCAKRVQPILNRPEPLTAFRNHKSKIRNLKSPFVSIRFFMRNEYNLRVISPFNPIPPMHFRGSATLLGQ